MSNTLKSRTARSAVFIVRESLKSLRLYCLNLNDPTNIERIVKESEILSMSLKKLERYLDAPTSSQPTDPSSGETPINVLTVNRVLSAVQEGRICGVCGGIIDGTQSEDTGKGTSRNRR